MLLYSFRLSFARSIVLGEISIPVNLKQKGATLTAILPVPMPISKTDLYFESSNASKNGLPSHWFIYSCKMGGSRNGSYKPYQYLRSAIYERRFTMYRSNRLFDEFIDIERDLNTGKVDHSPNGHKDALDAVCGATFTASKYAEQYAFDYGEDLDTVKTVSNSSSTEAI